MLIVTNAQDFKSNTDNNDIIGSPNLIGSEVKFVGENNILYCEPGVTLRNSAIAFQGNNSVVYIGKNNFSVNITVFNNSVFRIGKNTYINGKLTAITSEEKHIFIGDDCMISFGVNIRVADPHLIYSVKTYERINPSRSVFVGDHVWIGQSVLLLKGTWIGSGSILGGNSVAAGKKIPSNTSWAGNPARQIGSGVFWDSPCVHAWTEADTIRHQTFINDDMYIFCPKGSISFDYLDNLLTNAGKSEDKLIILKQLSEKCDKNRFAV